MKHIKLSILVLLLLYSGIFRSVVEASGDIEADFGYSTKGSPLFTINNFAPGNSITKKITVYNSAAVIRQLSIKGIKTKETGGFSKALEIEITSQDKTLYGGRKSKKTLHDFFSESKQFEGIFLGNLSPKSKQTLILTVRFAESSGNEYQSQRLTFNIELDAFVKIPHSCEKIQFSKKPIMGTNHSDRITGTQGNDLIIGFEGNDFIDGRGGNDCIIGGDGNDKLLGGEGFDFLFGGEGRDRCNGERLSGCEK